MNNEQFSPEVTEALLALIVAIRHQGYDLAQLTIKGPPSETLVMTAYGVDIHYEDGAWVA